MFSTLNRFSRKTAIIWYENIDATKQQIFTYTNIIKSAKIIEDILNDTINCTKSITHQNNDVTIAIALQHSAILVPLVIGIINVGSVFCFINPNDKDEEIFTALYDFGATFLIVKSTNISISKSTSISLVKHFTIFNEDMVLLKYSNKMKLNQLKGIMFCARTSGSTGKSKLIRIPYKCFQPNINSLTKILSITADDIFYISSPPTFDPFVLDLCLALTNGATIKMVSAQLRYNSIALIDLLFSNSPAVTTIQMTPSLFQRWNLNEIQQILQTDSSLRNLILGGETFPDIRLVSKWKNWNDCKQHQQTRIFNIYGLTEISCWCSIYEITAADIVNGHRIPLGNPMDDDIKYHVIDCDTNEFLETGSGELCIESMIRKCHIEPASNRLKENFYYTGDFVQKLSNGTIIFETRLNDVIKRFGKTVHLKIIEKVPLALYGHVVETCCIFDTTTNWLILFIRTNDEQQQQQQQHSERHLLEYFHYHCAKYEIPDKIIYLNQFPLSHHGKICKNELLEIFRQQMEEYLPIGVPNIGQILIDKLNFSLGTNICNEIISLEMASVESEVVNKRCKTEIDLSFLKLGGTSFLALNLASEIELIFGRHFQQLLPFLLDDNKSIRDIVIYLSTTNDPKRYDPQNDQFDLITLKPVWCVDLEKCIDASPTLCTLQNDEKIISCGSHSGILVNVSVVDGKMVSKLKLPNRIESTVVQYNEWGIVGCYNGILYCFLLTNGQICWTFNSNGMIKSKVLLINNCVIFGNYNQDMNLWCLNIENGQCLWSRKFGTKSIYSVPLAIDLNSILICSLDGTYGRINSTSGTIIWQHQLSSPIFSTPKLMLNSQRILIAEVSGIIHCINANGKPLWSFKADGNIYSSFDFLEDKISNKLLIFFGCYDRNVYCLSTTLTTTTTTTAITDDDHQSSISIKWKFQAGEQIFATPQMHTLMNRNVLIICTTNGQICICDAFTGRFIRTFKVNGNVFGTPILNDQNLLIGCRDNYLYNFLL